MHVNPNIDSAGASACAHVYPDVQQLLCRWHVDRSVHMIRMCVCA